MFNPMDRYWKVGGRSDVYHSARNIYVPTTDADFVARGAQAIPIPNEAEIWDQLQPFMPWWMWNGTTMAQPAEGQYSKDQLNNYNSQVRLNYVTGGVTSGSMPVKTDDRSRGFIQGARAAAEANSAFTTTWYGSDGNFYPLNASQVIRMSDDVAAHTNLCYATFADTASKIDAGQITTLDAIDSAYTTALGV
jgi:Domain of unknown function (DUF4376)